MFITGLLSYAAYNPDLPGNDLTPDKVLLGFYLFDWPTQRVLDVPGHPRHARHARTGTHPRPARQAVVGHPEAVRLAAGEIASQFLDRISLLLLNGGAVFEEGAGLAVLLAASLSQRP